MEPCTLGKRHSWAFVGNVIKRHQNGRTFHISERGKYRCECGQRKYGEPAYPYQQGETP